MNNKLTLIKVGRDNEIPTPEDLEKWRDIFDKAKDDPDFKIIYSKALSSKDLSIEEIDLTEDPNYITLVKVNIDNEWGINKEDLQAWKEIFQDARKDTNFVIFTHSNVSVERVEVGKSTMIITSDAVVMS